MMFLRYLRLALPFLLISLASFPVDAAVQQDTPYSNLSTPAPQVVNPSGAELIAITRAGDRLVAGGAHGIIIYSDDNGVTWHQASVPVTLTITDIAFATPKIGWAVGAFGVVLHTTDGGESWTRQLTGVDINNLILANATSAAAAAPNSPDSQRAVRRANIFKTAGPDKPLLAVYPKDPLHVTIFGAYRICVSTADGGATWHDCSLSVPDPISHNLYGVTPTAAGTYVAGEAGDLFLMDDNGGFTAITMPSISTLFGVIATNKGTLVAYGVAGALDRSTDGGKNWTAINIATQSDFTDGLQLSSGLIVLLSETGLIYTSSDDGQSFTPLKDNTGQVLTAAVQAANSNLVVASLSGIRVLQPADLQ
jgi:photosystem II stability/assembly factor-like uncharacterized protein